MPRSAPAVRLAACAVALGGGCALGGADDATPAPAGAVDPSLPPPVDPVAGGSGDASAPGWSDAGARSDASSRDATARDGAAGGDASGDATGGGACGVCDRTWVCNGFAQYWATEPDGRCVNQSNRTGLRCSGVLDGSTANNVGTWTGGPQGLTLSFQTLGGGVHIITCTP